MAKETTAYNHQHICFRCNQTYGGYNPNCKETKALMCGKCLAKEFNVTLVQQQDKAE